MKNIKNMVLSAMFLAIGLILPFFTGQIKQIGNMLLPMHFPIFLCGLVCGWQYGLTIGFILPILRSFLFGMPYMYPNAITMAFELMVYGFLSGFMYSHSKSKSLKTLYKCIIIPMFLGRIAAAVVKIILIGLGNNGFTLSAFIMGSFVQGIPGIIIQLVLIPLIVIKLDSVNKKNQDLS